MKNFFHTLIFIVISFFFFSCEKKQDFHKITFEVTFLDTPNQGASNFINVGVLPCERGNVPGINRFNVPKIWRYDYSVQKGDKVDFLVYGQLSYYYEMRVYIDGQQVSYRRVKTDDYTYYATTVEESYGLNEFNDQKYSGEIKFYY